MASYKRRNVKIFLLIVMITSDVNARIFQIEVSILSQSSEYADMFRNWIDRIITDNLILTLSLAAL